MKKIGTQTILSTERLGDEGRIRAVLAGWGMDAPAIERMLDEHRALCARTGRGRPRAALRSHPPGALAAFGPPPPAHSIR